MVKSKKMSKSAVAIIVLALLLVLSMVLGLTGAWFTAGKGGAGSTSLDFGTVSLTGQADEASYTITRNASLEKVVDHDEFTLNGVSVSNASDVAIYYVTVYSFDLYDAAGTNLIAKNVKWDGSTKAAYSGEGDEPANYWQDTDLIRGSFTGLTSEVVVVGFQAASAGESVTSSMVKVVTFDSEGKANGHSTDYMLKASLYVKAVQARHISSASELAGLLKSESLSAAAKSAIDTQAAIQYTAHSSAELPE